MSDVEPQLGAQLGINDLHHSPYHEAPRGGIQSAVGNSDQCARGRGRNEAVEPIHQPAMAWDELARVLGVELALDRGLREIARLRDDGENECNHRRGRQVRRRRIGAATTTPPTTPATVPPIAPDQVLFGLTRGISFGPPTARPTK